MTRHRTLVALVLVLYPLVQLAIRVAVSDGVEWDEAEQLVVTQSWALGYASFAAQPPLFTWLQIVFFSLFGVSTWALALLRACLQIVTQVALYRSARLLGLAWWPALLATLAVWLMPQFSVESLRMTHSVLVTCLAALLLHALLRLARRARTLDYVWLGVVVGLGGLAKYNFAVVAGALLAAAFSMPYLRRRIADRRLLLTALISGAIVAPHLAWVLGHLADFWGHIANKVGAHDGPWSGRLLARGAFLFARGIFVYLLPVVLWLALFGRSRRRRGPAMASLIERFWMLSVSALALGVIVFVIPRFREHWLQPFLFVLPLYLFLRPAGEPDARRLRAFGAAMAIMLVVLLGWKFVEIWAGQHLGAYSRLNDPFSALSARLREAAGADPAVIASDHHVVAGSLRIYFPRALVITPDYRDVDPGAKGTCLVTWDARRYPAPPPSLAPWLPAGAPIRYLEARPRRAPERLYRLGFVVVPACRLQAT